MTTGDEGDSPERPARKDAGPDRSADAGPDRVADAGLDQRDAGGDASDPDSGSAGSAGHAGTGDTAGTGGEGDSDDAGLCETVAVAAARVTPTIMLLIDGSQSMVTNPYGENSVARWDAVRDALLDSFHGLVPQLEHVVSFGLAIYGTMIPGGGESCPLPLGVVAPALDNREAIEAAWPAQPPGMFTPTGLALDAVSEMLAETASTDPAVSAAPQLIVLATDGDPNNCALGPFDPAMPQPDYPSVLGPAMRARDREQTLYVISVGSDANAAHLQEVANIGAGLPSDAAPGATVFYPEDADALAAVFSDVVRGELPCDLSLRGPHVRADRACSGRVELNGTALLCDDEHGWRLTGPATIRLLGDACDAFRADPDSTVSVSFPCDALSP